MAQASSLLLQRGQKNNQTPAQTRRSPNWGKSNETVTRKSEAQKQHANVWQQWEEAINEPISESSSSGKKSWADQVKEEERTEKTNSILDNFHISKISNAGFKLEYVSPIKQGKSIIVEID